jgi:uncharacterized protein (TIGR03792 family)
MVIEMLRVQVPMDEIDRYIRLDAEIWTPVLSACQGFLGKEVWSNPDGEIMMIVRWATREEWKAIPQLLLNATEHAFVSAIGHAVPFLEVQEYLVR